MSLVCQTLKGNACWVNGHSGRCIVLGLTRSSCSWSPTQSWLAHSLLTEAQSTTTLPSIWQAETVTGKQIHTSTLVRGEMHTLLAICDIHTDTIEKKYKKYISSRLWWSSRLNPHEWEGFGTIQADATFALEQKYLCAKGKTSYWDFVQQQQRQAWIRLTLKCT